MVGESNFQEVNFQKLPLNDPIMEKKFSSKEGAFTGTPWKTCIQASILALTTSLEWQRCSNLTQSKIQSLSAILFMTLNLNLNPKKPH